MGAWRSALCTSLPQIRNGEELRRASHKRMVLAPVVVIAMFRTKLHGDANMQQIN